MRSSSRTTWRGVVRSARERPEPSTIAGMDAERRELRPDDGGAGGRRAGPAEVRPEPLEQHLGVEVVRRDVRQADEVRHRRRVDPGDLRRLGGAVPRAALAVDADARPRAAPSRAGARPPSAATRRGREPAVDRDAAQNAADVAIDGEAGARRAAQAVEHRLVAEDRAVDAADPGPRGDRLRDRLDLGLAEGRVARALEVEVAAPDALLGSMVPVATTCVWSVAAARTAAVRSRSCRASRPTQAGARRPPCARRARSRWSRSRT